MFKEGDERLNHLDAAEITVVEEKVANALKWAENAQSLMNEFTDRTKDAPVPTSEIKNEMQVSVAFFFFFVEDENKEGEKVIK